MIRMVQIEPLGRRRPSGRPRRRAVTMFAVALAGALAVPGVADTLLVANKAEATLSLVDLPSGKVRSTLATGTGPHEVVTTADGRWAVVANYGGRSAAGASLTVVDVPAGHVVRTIDLGPHRRPHGLAWAGADRLLVTAEDDRALLVVAFPEGTVERVIPTGQELSHMVAATPDGRRAFVANIGSGSVTVLDLENGKKIRDVPTGAGAEGVEVSPDGTRVYVTNREADTVTTLDAETLAVLATAESRSFPIRAAVTPDGRQVLVSNARSGTLSVLDAREPGKIARTIELGDLRRTAGADGAAGERLLEFGESPVPIGIEISPDGRRAYVAASTADAVVVIDLVSFEVVGKLPAGQEPDGMAYSELEVREAPPAPAADTR